MLLFLILVCTDKVCHWGNTWSSLTTSHTEDALNREDICKVSPDHPESFKVTSLSYIWIIILLNESLSTNFKMFTRGHYIFIELVLVISKDHDAMYSNKITLEDKQAHTLLFLHLTSQCAYQAFGHIHILFYPKYPRFFCFALFFVCLLSLFICVCCFFFWWMQ